MLCSSLPPSFFHIFISLSLSIAIILPFSEGTQRRDVGGGKMGEDGEGKIGRRRKWNDGVTDER